MFLQKYSYKLSNDNVEHMELTSIYKIRYYCFLFKITNARIENRTAYRLFNGWSSGLIIDNSSPCPKKKKIISYNNQILD